MNTEIINQTDGSLHLIGYTKYFILQLKEVILNESKKKPLA
jgi:hypothetical protein